jgi:hypothetical protein
MVQYDPEANYSSNLRLSTVNLQTAKNLHYMRTQKSFLTFKVFIWSWRRGLAVSSPPAIEEIGTIPMGPSGLQGGSF